MATYSPIPMLLPGAAPLDMALRSNQPLPMAPRQDDAEAQREAQQRWYDEALLEVARQRFKLAVEHEEEWRKRAMQDLRFRFGGLHQWDEAVVKARQTGPNPRPILTMNLLPKFLRQITNDARQNRPSIRVVPVDSTGDPAAAKAAQGIIRHIEYASSAADAYDTARDYAATMGKGWVRIRTDYDDPWSFEQVILIDRITNPFSIYVDPQARRTPDYRLMDWLFDVEWMPKDRFLQKYEIDPATYTLWEAQRSGWVLRDQVQVANYWYTEHQPIALYQIRYPDGSTQIRFEPRRLAHQRDDVTHKDNQALLLAVMQAMAEQGVIPLADQERQLITRQRLSEVPIIYCAKINGHTILEGGAPGTLHKGKWIPYVPMLGEEIDMEGETDYRGIVRDAIDAQRAYNYWTTMEAETISLAPRAQWVGEWRQFDQFKRFWENANTTNYNYLPYKAVVEAGIVLPPPQRQSIEPAIQAISMARMQAANDLNQITGIYAPALGEPSNEKSGKAIAERQSQSEQGTSHFAMNEVRMITQLGRIVLDLLPKIYVEPERVVRILGEDGSQEMAMLHPGLPQGAWQQGQQPPANWQGPGLPQGIQGMYNLAFGKYDAIVEVGPSYKTRREEQAANLTQLAGAVPKVGEVIPDLIVGAQDFEGADEAARRLKRTLPPQLLDPEDTQQKPEEQVVALQVQMQQLQQDAMHLNAHAQQVEQLLHQAVEENKVLKQGHDVKVFEAQIKAQEAQIHHLDTQIKAQAEVNKALIEQQRLAMEQRAAEQPQNDMAEIKALLRQLVKQEQGEGDA